MKDLMIVGALSVLVLSSLVFVKQERISLVSMFEYYEKVKASQQEAYEIEKARKTTEKYEKQYVNIEHD